MKLSNALIEDVITEIAGKDVIPLVLVLKNKKNVSEFKLAELIKKEINATRNMLYRLYDYNLVSFTRKKDKKKGWYIYYWTFDLKRARYLIKNLKEKRIAELKKKLEKEQKGTFFSCQTKCIRLDFDQAMDFEFKCPECGQLISEEDMTKEMEKIELKITELEKELK